MRERGPCEDTPRDVTVDTDRVRALLEDAPLFSRLPARARAALLQGAVVRELSTDTRLLTAGRVNASLFIVLEGAVDVHLPGVDTPHVRLGRGECVGELSLIDGQPISADVVASMPATLLELSHEQVWFLIESSATFARNLLRVLAGRVRHDHAVLAESSGARRHYERLSTVDGLTTLHNRRWFDTMFPAHVTRLQQHGRPGALLMADVDRFKVINDEHGHAAGDAALRRIAGALVAGLRPGDLLARFGGEEFVALLGNTSEKNALEIAERLRRFVSAPAGDAPLCTISIGVAAIRGGDTFEALVTRADEALFRAKEAGRNRVSR